MCLQSSDELGFSLGEGVYKVSVNGAPKYTATHVEGKRITKEKRLKFGWTKVFIMRYSFTYGMRVSDSVSFPYQLQRDFGVLADIQNYGVRGFWNVQSYLQLKREVEKGNKPHLVIVNFCDFHHERNSLPPRCRNSLVLGYQRSNKEVSKQLAKKNSRLWKTESYELSPSMRCTLIGSDEKPLQLCITFSQIMTSDYRKKSILKGIALLFLKK